MLGRSFNLRLKVGESLFNLIRENIFSGFLNKVTILETNWEIWIFVNYNENEKTKNDQNFFNKNYCTILSIITKFL